MYRGKLRGYIVSLVNFNTSYMSSGLFNQSLYTTSFNFTPNSQTSLASYNFTNFTNKLLISLNNINLNFRTEAKSGVNKTLSTSSANSNKSETLEKADYNAKAGKRLADIAAKNTVGFTKQCATYVKRAIDNAGLGKYEYGDAYECANILKRNPNFKEISTAGLDLSTLPAGCVLVYDKGVSGYSSKYGHVEITLGNGQAASDGVTNNIRQGARVFAPVSDNRSYIA